MTAAFVDRPLVYLAGPYTNPDPVINTHNTIKVADRLAMEGMVTPYVPHLTLLWHLVVPHFDVDFWYGYDMTILARSDALLRLPGKSSGADAEVQFATDHNIPWFTSVETLYAGVGLGRIFGS